MKQQLPNDELLKIYCTCARKKTW